MSTLIRHLPWVMLALALLLLVAIAGQVATSMPPRTFTILTGPEGGGYYLAAQAYQRIAQEKGFDLQIRTTAGASETLDMLERGEAEVGFVQGGIAARGDSQLLSAIANVFYEPVWIFYRTDAFDGQPLTRLAEAQGKRVSLGLQGSGTYELASSLAAKVGLTPENTTFLNLSFDAAEAQLAAGDIDVALFVVSDASELPWRLIQTPGIALMSVERADAYAFYYPWLRELVLPEGGADVAANIPSEPKRLLATTANLVARNDMHPDLVRLMVIAAIETHRRGGRFEEPGEFPNIELTDLPVDQEAYAYMQQILSGRSFLDAYFPFWLASLIDRYLLFVVPALLIALPILSRSPQAFQWYMRQRIVRWYRIVHDIERRAQTMGLEEIDVELQNMAEIERTVGEELIVTTSYMPQVYQLRQHIEYVMEKLNKRKLMLQNASLSEV
jgi:TRAP transporter TAXI family solute receptor